MLVPVDRCRFALVSIAQVGLFWLVVISVGKHWLVLPKLVSKGSFW